MSNQPNRLPAEGEHRLKGGAIDRSKPLRFRLDGRLIHGLAGDTVLSAVLASGIVCAGTRGGRPLALDERFAPPVAVKRRRGAAKRAAESLPMARTPALDGLSLRTVGQRGELGLLGRLRRLLPTGGNRLALRYDGDVPLTPWLDTPPQETIVADIAVIGGGLAGMAAALAAAKSGKSVVLVEGRPTLGGSARLFGATGDEEAPDSTIQRLSEMIAGTANIRTLLRTEAFGVFPGLVQAHSVLIEGNIPVGRVVAIEAGGIVLANGAVERLPVFPGNRLPGVVSTLAAYERAERYGVWIGRRAIFATATSIAYRLAAQIKSDAVAVLKVADSRINPQSRFVEYGKAYGIPQLQDAIPRAAQPEGSSSSSLKVTLARLADGGVAPLESDRIDQLVVAGGWQADLTLWHMAGGASRWDDSEQRLVAEGSLSGIVLAGSVTGYETAAGCEASGAAAAAALTGKVVPAVEEVRIDALYETPDAPAPIAPPQGADAEPAYLDGGGSLTTRPEQVPRKRRGRRTLLTDEARSLSLSDVAAAVQLGIVPAEQAASIAQERCVTPGDLVDAGRRVPPLPATASPPGVPAYLAGRFGDAAIVREIEAADGRRFDAGCLIYANADRTDPLQAIGVVFAAASSIRGGLALMRLDAAILATASVRDISGPVAAQVRELRQDFEAGASGTPESDLEKAAAATGGEATSA